MTGAAAVTGAEATAGVAATGFFAFLESLGAGVGASVFAAPLIAAGRAGWTRLTAKPLQRVQQEALAGLVAGVLHDAAAEHYRRESTPVARERARRDR